MAFAEFNDHTEPLLKLFEIFKFNDVLINPKLSIHL